MHLKGLPLIVFLYWCFLGYKVKILMNTSYREVIDANDMLRMKTEEGDAYLAEIEVNLLLLHFLYFYEKHSILSNYNT